MSGDHGASDQGFATNGSPSEAQQQLANFWTKTMEEIKNLKPQDFKTQELPLARIKKIMKLDEDVKMISAEAPVLFAKAAEIFVNELTLRAWSHAEDNKRRTLQRNDIAMAISKYDQFDFLIDIVPREEIRPAKRPDDNVRTVMNTDQVSYYLQLAQQQQQQQAAVQPATVTLGGQAQQIQIQATPLLQQQLQLMTAGGASGSVSAILSQPTIDTTQPQVIQVQSPPPQPPTPQATAMQVFTQVVTPSGEYQNIPLQLTQAQMQAIALQMQGKQPGQPIIIQTDQAQVAADGTVPHSQTLFQLPVFNQLAAQSDGEQGSGDRDA